MKTNYNQSYRIVVLLLILVSLRFIPCQSNNLKTYFVYSTENKKLPSSKYIGINDINELFSIIKANKDTCYIKIILADGNHYITQPLHLDSLKNQMTIEALHYGKAILTSCNPILKNNITIESNDIISFPTKIETILLNVNDKYVYMPYSVERLKHIQ